MNATKLAIGTVVSTVFLFLLDWVWYGMLMKDSMTPLPNMKDPPDMLYLVLSYIIFSLAFVYIYGKGAEDGSKVSQGMKYGIWVTLLVSVGMGLMWYALTSTWPMSEMLTGFVYDLVKYILVGIIVAYATGIPGGVVDRDPGKASGGGQG